MNRLIYICVLLFLSSYMYLFFHVNLPNTHDKEIDVNSLYLLIQSTPYLNFLLSRCECQFKFQYNYIESWIFFKFTIITIITMC